MGHLNGLEGRGTRAKQGTGAQKAWHESVSKVLAGRSCFQWAGGGGGQGGAQGMELRKEERSQTGDEAEVRSSSPKPRGASSDSKHPFPIC